jgi:hypothetical protein
MVNIRVINAELERKKMINTYMTIYQQFDNSILILKFLWDSNLVLCLWFLPQFKISPVVNLLYS